MGLQGGFNHLRSDFTKLNLKNPGGPILDGIRGKYNPNFGAGLFYYSDIAYIGVSAPYLRAVPANSSPQYVSLQN